jgi:class 3 adenylate cyclase
MWAIVVFFAFTTARLRFPYATVLTVAGGAVFVLATFVVNPLDYGRHGIAFFYLTFAYLIGAIACRTSERRARDTFVARRLLEAEKAESERLLLNVLPPAIAERLKRGEEVIADGLDQVTILFSDIVGFTQLSARLEPERLVLLLNGVFTTFDELADRFGLEKIKTIGDAYMVAAGLPEPRADHAEAIARMALEMRDAADQWARQVGEPLSVRIGIHTGSVIAGVIGKRKFAYDMWGDTVNTASRMESHGLAGDIQVTAATYALLKDRFTFEDRGEIEVKGKGPMHTYLLREERPSSA